VILTLAIVLFVVAVVTSLGFVAWQARRRNLDRWLISYFVGAATKRKLRRGDRVDLILCVADHYEPKLGGAPPEQAKRRVDNWLRDYPRLFSEFQDSDGRPPQHTFFYPIEEYEPEYLDALSQLCHAGYGEVEIHLHHDNDNAENLRQSLLGFKETLSSRHGLLARDPITGEPVYAFIHGNWALDNSRPDGQCCGVNNELDVLRETGCYVDMTLPSAPSATQTRTINSLYYAIDDPERPKSHDRGVAVGKGPVPPESLMLIQGPLVLDWSRRRFGIVPRIENACLQSNQPAHIGRLASWLAARVQVPARPDWFFVKLHTHGASEENQAVLLGEPMVEFHRALSRRAVEDPNFQFHYVTAREMYNLVRAAEDGWKGPVAEARDYHYKWHGRESANALSLRETIGNG